MDLESIILSEVKSDRERENHMISLISGILKEMIQMNLFTEQKQIHRLREGTYGCWDK